MVSFLSLNTVLVSFLTFTYSLAEDKRLMLALMSAVGIVTAASWFFSIRSYKRLNRAKFQIINKMEKDLPYQNFSDEWDLLKRQTAEDAETKGMRKQWIRFKDRYTDLTNIEGVVPIVFGLIYVFLFVGVMFKVIIK